MVIVAALALSGCSAINAGYITKKEYSPSYTYYVNQCFSYNKDGLCTMNIPQPRTHPESWSFDLKNGDATGWSYVSESMFDAHEVGDWFDASGK